MKRRDFIRKSLSAGALAGGALTFGPYGNVVANTSSNAAVPYDLVAIKGGEPVEMYNKAMEVLGGIKNYVKKGQKVLVKPNIGWDRSPDYAATTNPALVKAIVKSCYEAGADQVYVFDHTCDNWNRCYTNSNIKGYASEVGAKVVPGNTEGYYEDVDIPKGKVLKTAKVHEKLIESDVFINVPILKNHNSTTMTNALKNLMGVIWDREWWHRNGLDQAIADFGTYRKPDLNIIDAYNIMVQNGPRGVSKSDVMTPKQLIVSDDMVAADQASGLTFYRYIANQKFNDKEKIDRYIKNNMRKVEYIDYAHKLGVGTQNLKDLEIARKQV